MRVDAASGQVTQRVPLPTRCVAQLSVSRDAVSAGELTLAGSGNGCGGSIRRAAR
jgi:hypothetical protein